MIRLEAGSTPETAHGISDTLSETVAFTVTLLFVNFVI